MHYPNAAQNPTALPVGTNPPVADRTEQLLISRLSARFGKRMDIMIKDTLLQELLQQKRSYESLLALNAAAKHRSQPLESILRQQLKQILMAIDDLQHGHHQENHA